MLTVISIDVVEAAEAAATALLLHCNSSCYNCSLNELRNKTIPIKVGTLYEH
jgi:hypothetical protein